MDLQNYKCCTWIIKFSYEIKLSLLRLGGILPFTKNLGVVFSGNTRVFQCNHLNPFAVPFPLRITYSVLFYSIGTDWSINTS